MVPLYVKLGNGIDSFYNERLEFRLDIAYPKAGILDYSNLSDEISAALNVATIVQISEEEYYDLIGSGTPVLIAPNYNLSITGYMAGCPEPADAFFVLRGNEFLKVSYTKLRECLSSLLGPAPSTTRWSKIFAVPELSLVGTDETIPGYEQSIYFNKALQDIDNIRVEVNGVAIYPTEDAEIDFYIFDKGAGTINRPHNFKEGETIAIYEI